MITLKEARAKAAALDAADEIAEFRERFVINDPDLIYMDGNSLGRLPKATRERLHHHINKLWGDRLARSWKEGNRTLQVEIG
ncbi:MAG: kynureninase, partial [Chloroflexota bacterium]